MMPTNEITLKKDVNIEIKLRKIYCDMDMNDAEEIAKRYYKKQGYQVINFSRSDLSKKIEVGKKFNFFQKKKDDNKFDVDVEFMKKRGLPDLFIFRILSSKQPSNIEKDGVVELTKKVESLDYRFVEVKSENDTLRRSQFNWFQKHPDLPLELCYVIERK